MYDVLAVDPHPLTWHIVLSVFANLGFSVWIVQVLALAAVTMAFYLFIKNSNLNIWVKILFGFSAGFFYYNGVIARDYSLIVLGLALIASTYKERFNHPIKYGLSLVFLSQSHFLAGGVVAIMVIGYFVEILFKKQGKAAVQKLTIKPWLGIAAMILISFVSILPMVISSFQSHALMDRSVTNKNSVAELFTWLNTTLYDTGLPLTQIMLSGLLICAILWS